MSEFADGYKEVYFNEYCSTCVHKDKEESEDPCWDCLEEGGNLNSHKPVKYEENTSKKIKTITTSEGN